nr:S49 family peptidase [Motiliproteus sediminis]
MSEEKAPAPDADEQRKEWKLIQKLVLSLTAEQRRSRRWGIFFKVLTFAYLTALLVLLMPDELFDASDEGEAHVALVEVLGTISQDDAANADAIVTGLRDAFEDDNTRAVIVRINSPGGSPVQAGYVYDEIRRLRALHPDTPVYSVIVDIGASGGYYIAAAADEIYADKASLVGSIGVISSSFGFVETLEKLGVERRVVTSGENKAFLDPFSPLKESEVAFWKGVLKTTHEQFIDQVRKGRGDRLVDDEALFSGLIWTGEQALELGLIDGLGSASYVARELVGEENIVNFTHKATPIERLAERFGATFAKTLATEMGAGVSPLR